MSTESWTKFALREPRVRQEPNENRGTDFFLSGLGTGSFDPNAYPKNLNQVNKLLREQGIPVTAITGRGYYYFVDSDGNTIDDTSVYTYRASDLKFGSWTAAAIEAAKKAAETKAQIEETAANPVRLVLRRRLEGLHSSARRR